MDLSVRCPHCAKSIPRKHLKPVRTSNCGQCGKAAPLVRVLAAEGVVLSVFECSDPSKKPGQNLLMGQSTKNCPLTIFGEFEEGGVPYPVRPQELVYMFERPDDKRVDEVLLMELRKARKDRKLTFGAQEVRCPTPTCGRYLRTVYRRNGEKCQECKAVLLDMGVVRFCREKDCREKDRRQYGTDLWFCETCKSRLEVSPGLVRKSTEQKCAEIRAKQLAEDGRVEFIEVEERLTPGNLPSAEPSIFSRVKNYALKLVGQDPAKGGAQEPKLDDDTKVLPVPAAVAESKKENDDE